MSEFVTTNGGLIVAIGLAWCWLVLMLLGDTTGHAIMAKLIGMFPGVSIALGGLTS